MLALYAVNVLAIPRPHVLPYDSPNSLSLQKPSPWLAHPTDPQHPLRCRNVAMKKTGSNTAASKSDDDSDRTRLGKRAFPDTVIDMDILGEDFGWDDLVSTKQKSTGDSEASEQKGKKEKRSWQEHTEGADYQLISDADAQCGQIAVGQDTIDFGFSEVRQGRSSKLQKVVLGQKVMLGWSAFSGPASAKGSYGTFSAAGCLVITDGRLGMFSSSFDFQDLWGRRSNTWRWRLLHLAIFLSFLRCTFPLLYLTMPHALI